MASLTRSEAAIVFTHILDNVLGRPDTSHLKQSLVADGVVTLFDLVTMEEDHIDTLMVEDDDNQFGHIDINRGDKNLIKLFLAFHSYQQRSGDTVDWLTITQGDFDNFRISARLPHPPTSTQVTSTTPITSNPPP